MPWRAPEGQSLEGTPLSRTTSGTADASATWPRSVQVTPATTLPRLWSASPPSRSPTIMAWPFLYRRDLRLEQGLRRCWRTATYVLVSDEEEAPSRIMRSTTGGGVDRLRCRGGQGFRACLWPWRRLGVVIVYGMLSNGAAVKLMLPTLMLGNITLRGFSADMLTRARTRGRGWSDGCGLQVVCGALRPVTNRPSKFLRSRRRITASRAMRSWERSWSPRRAAEESSGVVSAGAKEIEHHG